MNVSSRLKSLARINRFQIIICTQRCSFSDYIRTIKQVEAEKAEQRKQVAELEEKQADLQRQLHSLQQERERLNIKLEQTKRATVTEPSKIVDKATEEFFPDPINVQESQEQLTNSERSGSSKQWDDFGQLHDLEDEHIFNQDSEFEKLTDPEQITKANSKVYKLLRKGKELKRYQQSSEAIETFRQAIQLEQIGRNKPEVLADLWVNIAWVYCSDRKTSHALKAANIAMRLNPKNASSYEICGIIFKHIGDKQRAKIYWKKTIELDPNRTTVKERLNKLI